MTGNDIISEPQAKRASSPTKNQVNVEELQRELRATKSRLRETEARELKERAEKEKERAEKLLRDFRIIAGFKSDVAKARANHLLLESMLTIEDECSPALMLRSLFKAIEKRITHFGDELPCLVRACALFALGYSSENNEEESLHAVKEVCECITCESKSVTFNLSSYLGVVIETLKSGKLPNWKRQKSAQIARTTPPKECDVEEPVVVLVNSMIECIVKTIRKENDLHTRLKDFTCVVDGKQRGGFLHMDGLIGNSEDFRDVHVHHPTLLLKKPVMGVEVKTKLAKRPSSSSKSKSKYVEAYHQCLGRVFQALDESEGLKLLNGDEGLNELEFKRVLKEILPIPFLIADANSIAIVLLEYDIGSKTSFPICMKVSSCKSNLNQKGSNLDLDSNNLTLNSLLIVFAIILSSTREPRLPYGVHGELMEENVTGVENGIKSNESESKDDAQGKAGKYKGSSCSPTIGVFLNTINWLTAADGSTSTVTVDRVVVVGQSLPPRMPEWLVKNSRLVTKVLSEDEAYCSNEVTCWNAAYRKAPFGVPRLWVGRDLRGKIALTPDGLGFTTLTTISRPVSLPKTRELVLKLLAILEKIHEAGVVHGDLHPGNILVRPGAHSKDKRHLLIIDFGCARMHHSRRKTYSLLTHAAMTLSVRGTALHHSGWLRPKYWQPQPEDDVQSILLIGEWLLGEDLDERTSPNRKRSLLATSCSRWGRNASITEREDEELGSNCSDDNQALIRRKLQLHR